MGLTGDSNKQVPDKSLDNPLDHLERAPRTLRDQPRQIAELRPEPTISLKLGAAPRKVVWWPSSCRGIVG